MSGAAPRRGAPPRAARVRAELRRAALVLTTSFLLGLAMATVGAPGWPTMLVAFLGGVAVVRLAEVVVPAERPGEASPRAPRAGLGASSSAGARGAESTSARIGCSDPECWSCDGHWTTEEEAALARRSLALPRGYGVELYRCPTHGMFERLVALDAEGCPPVEVACALPRGPVGYTTWPCGESSRLVVVAFPATPAVDGDPGNEGGCAP